MKYKIIFCFNMHINSEKFEKFGFGKNESKVYFALAGMGRSSVAEIMDRTDLHPNLAYRALDNLERDGFVSKTIIDHKQNYSICDPDKFIELAEDGLENAREISKEIKKLSKKAEEAQKVTIFQGKKAVVMARKFIIDSICDGGTYYVLNSNIAEFGKAMGGEFERQERELVKRGIKQEFIAYKNQIDEYKIFEKRYFKRIKRDFFVLDERETMPMSVDFSEKRVAILVFGKIPLAVGVDDNILASGYKKLFETLKIIAKKYR